MKDYIHKLDYAKSIAEKSKARRLKVGCAIIDNKDNILITGYNHMPKGFGDNCEDDTLEGLVTKKELIHAEEDAITTAAKIGLKLEGTSIYITHSPCLSCAKLIVQSGIKTVIYHEEYRLKDGIDFLRKCNINIIKI